MVDTDKYTKKIPKRYFWFGMLFLAWLFLLYFWDAYLKSGSFFTKVPFVFGICAMLILLLLYVDILRIMIRGAHIIWPGGSSTYDPGLDAGYVPAPKRPDGSKVGPDCQAFPLGSWKGRLMNWPGGGRDGYIVAAEWCIHRVGNNLMIDTIDVVWFNDEKRKREMLPWVYKRLKNWTSRTTGWDEEARVGLALLPGPKVRLSKDDKKILDNLDYDKYLTSVNRTLSKANEKLQSQYVEALGLIPHSNDYSTPPKIDNGHNSGGAI